MKKIVMISSIIFCLIVFFTIAASAGEITFAWDHNGDVDGFQVFMKKSSEQFDFSAPVWTGAEKQCHLTDLDDNVEYDLVVRAFRGQSVGPNSAEIHYTPTPEPEPIVIPQRVHSIRLIFE